MARRWIRLDAEFDESQWVNELTVAAQLAWVKLLCRVKRHGVQGRCKRPDPQVWGKQTKCGVRAVLAMEAAAVKDEALSIVDGDWIVHNWPKYQIDPRNSERVRRHRERRKKDVTVTSGRVTVTHPPVTVTSPLHLSSVYGEGKEKEGEGKKTRASGMVRVGDVIADMGLRVANA